MPFVAVASFQPAGQGAVCCLWAASSIIRIGKVADLAHLLQTTLGKLSTDISGVLFAFPRHDQAKGSPEPALGALETW
jgi:hypothetical protein